MVYIKKPSEISETQFSFRSGLGTRDALFGLNVLLQRRLDMNQETFFEFVDYEKALNRVKHKKKKIFSRTPIMLMFGNSGLR